MALYNLPMPIWLFLLLFPLMLLLKKIKQVKTQNMQLPPGPPKLPIIGNLLQLGALPHQSFRELSKKYGPVMLVQLGRVPIVVVSSFETAKVALKTRDLSCCGRPLLAGNGKISYNYLDVGFAPYGDHWRQLRKICTLKLFSLKRVQSFGFIREEEVASLMSSISQAASSAIPVDLSEKMHALTGSIIFRMAFGMRFQGSNFDNHRFGELLHTADALVASVSAEECFPYVGWIIDRLTGYHAKLDRVFRELDAFFHQIIVNHLKPERTKEEQEDIVDVLLKIERDQPQFLYDARFTKDHIKAVIMDVFLGGVNTSAIVIVWAMAELAKNSRVMSKAQDEVRNCVGKKGRVTEADIDELQYLKMIIKETLRLHPPAGLLIRETISHVKINGYDIYPNTLMQVNAWALGRDPKHWKNPEEFFPERFIDNSVDFKGLDFEFLPFGAGRRICPGMPMGIITTELTLANLLYRFNWKLPNGMREEDLNMEEAAGQSLTISKKMPLILEPLNYV